MGVPRAVTPLEPQQAPKPAPAEVPAEAASPAPRRDDPDSPPATATGTDADDAEAPAESSGDAGTQADVEADTDTGAEAGAERWRPLTRVSAAFRSVDDGGTGLWRWPELWSLPRPPLAEVVAYLRTAPWTTTTGVWRLAGRAYSGLAIALVAVAYVVAWLAERPTRAGIATALIVAGYLIRF